MERNVVVQGHVIDCLRRLPAESVDVVVTSPPYWGKRDYGDECVSVWGGEATCDHKWGNDLPGIRTKWGNKETLSHKQKSNKGASNNIDALEKSAGNFCSCGAWRGQLGLEPHPKMFIEHLVSVFREVKRVLKKSGIVFLNLGDTYFGDNGVAVRPEGWEDLEKIRLTAHAPAEFIRERNRYRSNWLQPKQKMLIPPRVAIALQDDGWLVRNDACWIKENPFPESVIDRFSCTYEPVYVLAKNRKYYFDLDKVRKPFPASTIQRFHRQFISDNKTYNKNFTANKHLKFADKVKSGVAKGANPGDCWVFSTENLKEEHFAAYPQKLVEFLLSCSCPKGGLVLDPFAGSGTTLIVAYRMGFDYYGIELVPKYIDIIKKRIAKYCSSSRLDNYVSEVNK